MDEQEKKIKEKYEEIVKKHDEFFKALADSILSNEKMCYLYNEVSLELSRLYRVKG